MRPVCSHMKGANTAIPDMTDMSTAPTFDAVNSLAARLLAGARPTWSPIGAPYVGGLSRCSEGAVTATLVISTADGGHRPRRDLR